MCAVNIYYIYIIYTPNLELGIAVSVREREQGGSTQQARSQLTLLTFCCLEFATKGNPPIIERIFLPCRFLIIYSFQPL